MTIIYQKELSAINMNKEILLCDIGNTQIGIGISSGEKIDHSWRLQTSDRTEDEFFVLLKSLLSEIDVAPYNIEGVVISSVVPYLTKVFRHLSKKYLGISPIVVSAELELGLDYGAIKYPQHIGADLIANAFASYEKYGKTERKNCIVVDFGTATTLQLITYEGKFIGTIISPGVLSGSESLIQKAAQLGEIELHAPKALLGNDTRSAMLSGIIIGTALMVDGFILRIKEHYSSLPGDFLTIATGGISELISTQTNYIDLINKNLTLEGLLFIYSYLK